MPTDDSAEANPITWASVSPMVRPAAPMRSAMARMSCSVDAPSLPRATSADPALDACDGKTPMMLPSFARPVAASSDVRLVVSPRSIMVRVNAATSARFTPS